MRAPGFTSLALHQDTTKCTPAPRCLPAHGKHHEKCPRKAGPFVGMESGLSMSSRAEITAKFTKAYVRRRKWARGRFWIRWWVLPGEKEINVVDHVERRLGFWLNKQTRAEGARLLVTDGKELGEVLQQYPNEVPYMFRGKPSRADRRAIRAHYSLLQQAVGGARCRARRPHRRRARDQRRGGRDGTVPHRQLATPV